MTFENPEQAAAPLVARPVEYLEPLSGEDVIVALDGLNTADEELLRATFDDGGGLGPVVDLQVDTASN